MGKVVLITGCTEGGIGYCLAEEFAANGHHVYASARRPQTMERLPSSVRRVVLDVNDAEACEQAIATVIQEAGRLDILVNNAAIGYPQPLMDTTIDEFRAHYETNVIAGLRMTQLAVPHMAKQKTGSIINIGSGLGYFSLPFTGAYSSTKHALHNLTDMMRLELNPLGIDVMLVAPGFIKTSMSFSAGTQAFSKPSAFGYEAFTRGVDLINFFQTNFGSSPKALAKKVVRAAGGSRVWGVPTRINYGLGIDMAVLHSWLPKWVSDWLLGLWFDLYPRWRSSSMMAAARKQEYSVNGVAHSLAAAMAKKD